MGDLILSKEATMRSLFLSAGVACLFAIVGALSVGAAPAQAIEIRSFVAGPTDLQAGGHPDLGISYAGETASEPDLGLNCQCNEPKIVDIDLPTGFIGNPHATPQCVAADFVRNVCSADSQIGVVSVAIKAFGFYLTDPDEPIYNSVPTPAQAGLLSFKLAPEFFDIPFYTVLEARTGSDYGLSANTELTHFAEPQSFNLTLWGVPADPSHDALRVFSNQNQTTPTPSNSPAHPVPTEPDHLHRELEQHGHRRGLRQQLQHCLLPVAHGRRLRPAQLRPQPERQADHDRGGRCLRRRHRPHGAATAERAISFAVRAQSGERDPAGGVLDQPQRRGR